jgi:hypothetical protein
MTPSHRPLVCYRIASWRMLFALPHNRAVRAAAQQLTLLKC